MQDSEEDNKREGLCLDERGKAWGEWIGPRTGFALIDHCCYLPPSTPLPLLPPHCSP